MASEQLQQLIIQAQAYQQQAQMVAAQKEALNMQLIETGKATEELSKPAKDDVYRVVGPILVRAKREDARRDIESRKELIILRMSTLEKTESKLKAKLDELKGKLSKAGE